MKMERQIMRTTSSGTIRASNQTANTHASPLKRPAQLALKISRNTSAAKSPSASPETSCEKKGLLGGKKTLTLNDGTTPCSGATAETSSKETQASKTSVVAPTLSAATYETFCDERAITSLPEPNLELKEVEAVALTASCFRVCALEVADAPNFETEEEQTIAPTSIENSHPLAADFTEPGLELEQIKRIPSTSFLSSTTAVKNIDMDEERKEFKTEIAREPSSIDTPAAEDSPKFDRDLQEFNKAIDATSETAKRPWDMTRQQENETQAKTTQKLKDNGQGGILALLNWRTPIFVLIGLFILLSVPFSVDMSGGGPMIPPPT